MLYEMFYRESLLKIFELFLENHLRVFQGRCLRVIESAAVIHPELIAELIPCMTQAIQASEKKRGVGVDKQLRYSSASIISF